MKTLKTFAVLALFMITSVAFAQQGPGGRQQRSVAERAKAETETLITTLSLDAAQTLKVLEISKKYAAKDSVRFAAMRQAAEGVEVDREAMMTQMRAVQEAKNTEIQAILTEPQVVKYKAYVAERATRMGGGQRPQ